MLLPPPAGPTNFGFTAVCPYTTHNPPSESPSPETESMPLVHFTISETIDTDNEIESQCVEEDLGLI